MGRFLGVSHHVGSLMSFWVLPVSGIPISRTTVQRVTNLESSTNQNEKRFEVYDKRIADRFNEEYIGANYLQNHHQKPDVELWEELAGDDKAFYEEFARVITNDYIPEADDGPEFARVTKRLKDKDGLPIEKASENPILATRMYEVEYADGYKTAMAANAL